jgi:hypothetical protein
MSDPADLTDPNAIAAAAGQAAAATPETAEQVLARLRDLELQLFSLPVIEQVKQLPSAAEKQAFVAARLHLTAVVAQLNAAVLGDIRSQLEQESTALRQGIGDLTDSLDRLQGAVGWAAAINSVIGVVGQVVSLL